MAKKSYKNPADTQIFLEEPIAVYQRKMSPDSKAELFNFYAQQIEEEANKFWDEGKIGYELLNQHLRTSYK